MRDKKGKKWDDKALDILQNLTNKDSNLTNEEIAKEIGRTVGGVKYGKKLLNKRKKKLKLDYSINRNKCIGVDEVALGCIAGPIIFGAVLLGDNIPLGKIKDSKKFSNFNELHQIANLIKKYSTWYNLEVISLEEINITRNFAESTHIGQLKILSSAYQIFPNKTILFDGKPPNNIPISISVIEGMDDGDKPVSAASIIAKSKQVKIMEKYHQKYPEYDFINNHGYATPRHKKSIKENGITPVHRFYAKDLL